MINQQKTKKIFILTLAMASMVGLSQPASAQIYKVIDENTGQVTYTDKPVSASETLKIIPLNISQSTPNNGWNNPSQPAVSQQGVANDASNESRNRPAINYQVTIVEPSQERAYRRPMQSIDVQAQIYPSLQNGDQSVILIDGNQVAEGTSASINTVDLNPGQHTVTVSVKGSDGQTLASASQTIYVIQHTLAVLKKQEAMKRQALALAREQRMYAVRPFPNSSE